MEAKDSYSFPLYHRIGQAARPVIASRYWIVIVLIVAILLYTPFLFSGFFQDDYGFRIQFSQDARERVDMPEEVLQYGPLNLYGFSSDSTTFRIGRDKGFTPWWASEEIKTNFFRPLSSLTLAFDHRVVDGADAVVVVTPWNEFMHLDMERIKNAMRQPIMIDGRNLYEPVEMRELGFTYRGIGRGYNGEPA